MYRFTASPATNVPIYHFTGYQHTSLPTTNLFTRRLGSELQRASSGRGSQSGRDGNGTPPRFVPGYRQDGLRFAACWLQTGRTLPRCVSDYEPSRRPALPPCRAPSAYSSPSSPLAGSVVAAVDSAAGPNYAPEYWICQGCAEHRVCPNFVGLSLCRTTARSCPTILGHTPEHNAI